MGASWHARSTPSTRRRGHCPVRSSPRSSSRAWAKRVPSAERARSSRGAGSSARSPAATDTPSAATSAAPARPRRRRCPSRWSAPSAARASWLPAGRAARAPSSTAARAIPSATSRRRASRSARSTMPTPARLLETPMARSACAAAPRSTCRPRSRPGRPSLVDRPIRRRCLRRGGRLVVAGASRRASPPASPRADRAARAAALGRPPRDESAGVRDRLANRPGESDGAEALDAFLGGLAARDASVHTRRAYRTAVEQYLEWLAAQGDDWRAPSRAVLRGYLAALAARPLSRRSISSRLAALRSFYRHARREGQVEADPWTGVMTPRLPRRLPKVLSIHQVETLIDEAAGSAGAADAGAAGSAGVRRQASPRQASPRQASPRPLVLRDLALIETVYAAGLRISELAGA